MGGWMGYNRRAQVVLPSVRWDGYIYSQKRNKKLTLKSLNENYNLMGHWQEVDRSAHQDESWQLVLCLKYYIK